MKDDFFMNETQQDPQLDAWADEYQARIEWDRKQMLGAGYVECPHCEVLYWPRDNGVCKECGYGRDEAR